MDLNRADERYEGVPPDIPEQNCVLAEPPETPTNHRSGGVTFSPLGQAFATSKQEQLSSRPNTGEPTSASRTPNVTMLPEDAVGKRASHAMVLENVSALQLRDLSVRWADEGAEPK